MDFFDFADGARLNQFNDATIVGGSVNNGTHLGGKVLFFGDALHVANFSDVMRERLFAEARNTAFHGGQRNDGMRMIRGADEDGVERFELVKHCAIVEETLGVGESFALSRKVVVVDVAKTNHFDEVARVVQDFVNVAVSASANTNDG